MLNVCLFQLSSKTNQIAICQFFLGGVYILHHTGLMAMAAMGHFFPKSRSLPGPSEGEPLQEFGGNISKCLGYAAALQPLGSGCFPGTSWDISQSPWWPWLELEVTLNPSFLKGIWATGGLNSFYVYHIPIVGGQR